MVLFCQLLIIHLSSAFQAGRNPILKWLGPLEQCEFVMNPLMSTVIRQQEEIKNLSSPQKRRGIRGRKNSTSTAAHTSPATLLSTDFTKLEEKITQIQSAVENFEQINSFCSRVENFESSLTNIIDNTINATISSQKQQKEQENGMKSDECPKDLPSELQKRKRPDIRDGSNDFQSYSNDDAELLSTDDMPVCEYAGCTAKVLEISTVFCHQHVHIGKRYQYSSDLKPLLLSIDQTSPNHKRKVPKELQNSQVPPESQAAQITQASEISEALETPPKNKEKRTKSRREVRKAILRRMKETRLKRNEEKGKEHNDLWRKMELHNHQQDLSQENLFVAPTPSTPVNSVFDNVTVDHAENGESNDHANVDATISIVESVQPKVLFSAPPTPQTLDENLCKIEACKKFSSTGNDFCFYHQALNLSYVQTEPSTNYTNPFRDFRDYRELRFLNNRASPISKFIEPVTTDVSTHDHAEPLEDNH